MASLLSGCAAQPEEQSTEVQPVVKVERLELVDKNGATRAVLTTIDGDRPSLALMDKDGKFRAWLFLGADGRPNLALIDEPRLLLMDKAEQVRSAYRLDANGAPALVFTDTAGKGRLRLLLGEDGAPGMDLFGVGGESLWSAP